VGLALDLVDYHPSVLLLLCWLGHLTCKIISEMTYNVSSGTLNPTIPYNMLFSLHSFMAYAVCRLVEAYDVHQKLQQELQVIKKHRLSAADTSQYVC